MRKNLLTCLAAGLCGFASAQPCINNTHSLNFGGSSAVTFTTNNNLNIANTITVEAWVYPTSFAALPDNGTILCHHSWTMGTEMGYVLRAGGTGQVVFNIAGITPGGTPNSWTYATSSSNAIALNTWSHVAGTFDGTMIRVYVNGIQVGSTPFTGTISPATAYPVAIGRLSDNGVAASRYWNGRIDEVRVWSRALISAEILAKKNTHLNASQETGLVGYWRFNEGSGSSVADSSGSGNNGTLSGATFVTPVPFNQSAVTPVVVPNGNTLTSTAASSYQWNLNGTPISGATSQSWTAVQNGSYTVTVTDSLGCSATSGPYFITTLGISDLSDGSTLAVSHAANVLSITSDKLLDWVRIIDLSGKVISEQHGLNTAKVEILTYGFTTGIYVIDAGTDSAIGRTKVYIQ